MKCPCCPSELHHRVMELKARLDAPVPLPTVQWIAGELRSMLDENEERWEIAERSVDDFDAYDPSEHREAYDDVLGSDNR